MNFRWMVPCQNDEQSNFQDIAEAEFNGILFEQEWKTNAHVLRDKCPPFQEYTHQHSFICKFCIQNIISSHFNDIASHQWKWICLDSKDLKAVL